MVLSLSRDTKQALALPSEQRAAFMREKRFEELGIAIRPADASPSAHSHRENLSAKRQDVEREF